MKQILKYNVLFFIILMLTSCGVVRIPLTGKTPTREFTLAPYLCDGAVFSQRETVIVAGEAEEGVLLTITVYDSKGREFKKMDTFADENDTFRAGFKAPKGSFEKFSLVINDSINEKTIKEIVFGEVWIIIGENYHYEQEDTPIITPKNVAYFSYHQQKYQWNQVTDEQTPIIATKLGAELVDKLQVPIGIILSTTPTAHFDSWLSKEKIDLQSRIASFIKENNRYIESEERTYNDNDTMSAMYVKTLKIFEGLYIKGALVKLGNNDYKTMSPNIINFNQKMHLALQVVVEQLSSLYNGIDVYFIQEGFRDVPYAGDLRETQAIGTYLHSNAHIIATYDLYEKHIIDEDIYEIVLDYDALVARFLFIINNSTYEGQTDYQCPSYTNHVVSANKISIEFYNCNQIETVDEISSLVITDGNDNEIAFTFTIANNWLHLYLDIDDENEYDLTNITVKYGVEENIYLANLKSDLGLPIVPFTINYRGVFK